MNTYLVEVSAEIPYPWPRTYREEAANEGTAISRALKAYRVDVRNRSGHSKKMTKFTCRLERLSAAQPGKEAGHE